MLTAASARAQPDGEPPAITHEEVRSGRLGAPVTVSALIVDPSGIFDPAVLYRVGGQGDFLRLPMQSEEDERYAAVIPGDVVSDDLEYFIEAFDEQGNGPARYADADLPVKVRILKTAEPLPVPPAAGAVESEGEDGGGLWIVAGVVGAGLLMTALAATGVGAWVLLSPPAVPSQVDVVVSAPTPVSTGLLP